MKAMIFAAGYGKRLLPVTQHIPKALVKIQRRPMLDWIIENLISFGIKEIIINICHLSQKIISHLDSRQYPIVIKISYEEKMLGTGGGLYQTKDFWGDADFFVCNGDILCDADLNEFYESHKGNNSLVSLAVNDEQSTSMLLIDGEGFLVGRQKNGKRELVETPVGDVKEVGFCGLHVISPELFSCFSSPVAFSIIDEYFDILKKGVRISTWHIKNAYWSDIGTLESLESANRRFNGFTHASS